MTGMPHKAPHTTKRDPAVAVEKAQGTIECKLSNKLPGVEADLHSLEIPQDLGGATIFESWFASADHWQLC